jgi:hypothetical protein
VITFQGRSKTGFTQNASRSLVGSMTLTWHSYLPGAIPLRGISMLNGMVTSRLPAHPLDSLAVHRQLGRIVRAQSPEILDANGCKLKRLAH